jgi:hypothetical protein
MPNASASEFNANPDYGNVPSLTADVGAEEADALFNRSAGASRGAPGRSG